MTGIDRYKINGIAQAYAKHFHTDGSQIYYVEY